MDILNLLEIFFFISNNFFAIDILCFLRMFNVNIIDNTFRGVVRHMKNTSSFKL